MNPICDSTNIVITKCNHCFHTSCLMSNVDHNDFRCPCCRTTMIEKLTNYSEPFQDNVLRGMRLLLSNATGEQITLENDNCEENIEQLQLLRQQEEEEEEINDIPSLEYITEKLCDKGITTNQLVQCMLRCHYEYVYDLEVTKSVNDVYGKIRAIIHNYHIQNYQRELHDT